MFEAFLYSGSLMHKLKSTIFQPTRSMNILGQSWTIELLFFNFKTVCHYIFNEVVTVFVFAFVDFKEEQVPSAAIDVFARQLIVLSYLVFFTCRYAVFDLLVFILCKLQRDFDGAAQSCSFLLFALPFSAHSHALNIFIWFPRCA